MLHQQLGRLFSNGQGVEYWKAAALHRGGISDQAWVGEAAVCMIALRGGVGGHGPTEPQPVRARPEPQPAASASTAQPSLIRFSQSCRID